MAKINVINSWFVVNLWPVCHAVRQNTLSETFEFSVMGRRVFSIEEHCSSEDLNCFLQSPGIFLTGIIFLKTLFALLLDNSSLLCRELYTLGGFPEGDQDSSEVISLV